MTNALPPDLAGLLEPGAYPHPVSSVDLVETHLAWIFLAGEFAYKVKRPVRLPFVDQRPLDKRAFLCGEELHLNRRFAPQLYLEVVKIVDVGGAARIGVEGKVLDFAVRMRRFAREQQLDRLVTDGHIDPLELQDFGASLAERHATLPHSTESQPWGWPSAVRRIVSDNLAQCESALQARFAIDPGLSDISSAMAQRIEALSALMTVRIAEGAIRECHGDLHSRNIVRYEGQLTAYDSLEFEPAFRWIDVAEEIAFLTVDLKTRDRPAHAHAFLTGWLTQSGDYAACRLINLYEAHHALVRAKVIALSPDDSGESSQVSYERAVACLAAARHAFERRTPVLILVGGLSGSGKTTLAAQLAQALSAVHLRSDIERKRKRLYELRWDTRSDSKPGEGRYTPEASERVQLRLQACAQACVAGGLTTIVDATFNLRAERQRFRELADRTGIRLVFIRCNAPIETLRSRIRHRAAQGEDASEATLEILDWQVARAEAITPDEDTELMQVETDTPGPAPSFARILEFCSTANARQPSHLQ